MVELLDSFGAEGYGVWSLILEIIGAEVNDQNRCETTFSWRNWVKKCHVSSAKLTKIVSFMVNQGLVEAEFLEKHNQMYATLRCNKLLKYKDEYRSRKKEKSRQTPDKLPTDSRQTPAYTDTETDTDTETEKSSLVEGFKYLGKDGQPHQFGKGEKEG